MQCTICFRNIDVYAVLPCNHNICCSECIFKEIALFGNRKCPYCKAIVKTPIFTVIPKKTYSELQGEYRFKHNKEYDIDFDNEIVEKWHLDLLIMRCTVCDPYVPYSKINEKSYARHEIEDYGTVGSLQDHLRAEHGKMICSLCANKGRLFPYELKLYARQVIQAHMSGVLKDPSQPIHVPCPVCNKVQYDAREVLIHCRANHVHCFLCGINDPSYVRVRPFLESSTMRRRSSCRRITTRRTTPVICVTCLWRRR